MFLTCAYLCSISPLWAHEDWQKLKSPHFEIVFDAGQRKLAELYLNQAESVYKVLSPIFQESPPITNLVLKDETDLSNGSSTVFPIPTIMIYPIPPSDLDTISNYNNYAYQLILHEYTHTLNMYPVHGIPKVVESIFGAWAHPNMFLPKWYMEGMAVDIESTFSQGHGRLNSAYYPALVRAFYQDQDLNAEGIDRLNEFVIPSYPYGSRPYFFGAYLMQEIAHTKGTKAFYTLNQRYSERMPWLIETPMEEVTGQEYEAFWLNTREKLAFNAKTQIEKIEQAAKGPEETHKISPTLSFQSQLEIDGAHNLYLLVTKENYQDQILQIPYENIQHVTSHLGEEKALLTEDKIFSFQLSKSKKQILYSAIHTVDRKYNYADAFLYDIETKKKTPLTQGERTKEVIYGPEEKTLLYISFKDGAYELRQKDLADSHTEVLFTSQLYERLSNPVLTNQGELLFLSKHPNTGKIEVHAFNLKNKSEKILPTNFQHLAQIRKANEGFSFISEDEGVSNLYVTPDLWKSASPVTNTKTHIFNGFILENTAFISELDSSGAFWKQVPLMRRKTFQLKDSVQSEIRTQTSAQDYNRPVETENAFAQTPSEAYNSFHYLFPRYWLPFIATTDVGTYYTVQTSAADPVGLQSYSLLLGYYTQVQQVDSLFTYLNKKWDIDWSFIYSKTNQWLEASSTSVADTYLKLMAAYEFEGLSKDWSFRAYAISRESEEEHFDSQKSVGVGIGAEYSSVANQGPRDLLPPHGYKISLDQTEFFPIQDYIHYHLTELEWHNFFSKWLPERNVLYSKLLAAYSERGNRRATNASVITSAALPTLTPKAYRMRGYPIGNFLGWTAVNLQLEYNFPLFEIHRGYKAYPFFLRRIYAAVVGDAITLDGAYYYKGEGPLLRTETDKYFASYGIEAKTDWTLFYNVPVTITAGFYNGTDKNAGGKQEFLFGFLYSGFF